MSKDVDAMADLRRYAQQATWRRHDINVLRPELMDAYPPIVERIQHHLRRSDARHALMLPDLSAFENETVAALSDYAGEDKDALYLTYSVLVCGWNIIAAFDELTAQLRARHGLKAKEIAYKDFRLEQVLRALPDYLRALDTVPGFLFTVAVDKRLDTVFGSPANLTRLALVEAMRDAGFSPRKPKVIEKLLRSVHVSAFLTGLLARNGQKIFWMTDHDAIAPNATLHKETLDLFQRVLGNYTRPGYEFALIGGATPFEERHLPILDLLSAADIAAGAIAQSLTRRDKPEDHELKLGCEAVLEWLGRDGIGLKKMTLLMRPGANGTIETAQIDIQSSTRSAVSTIIPIIV